MGCLTGRNQGVSCSCKVSVRYMLTALCLAENSPCYPAFVRLNTTAFFASSLVFMLPDGTKKEKEEMNHSIFIVGPATACLLHLDKSSHGEAGDLQNISD